MDETPKQPEPEFEPPPDGLADWSEYWPPEPNVVSGVPFVLNRSTTKSYVPVAGSVALAETTILPSVWRATASVETKALMVVTSSRNASMA